MRRRRKLIWIMLLVFIVCVVGYVCLGKVVYYWLAELPGRLIRSRLVDGTMAYVDDGGVAKRVERSICVIQGKAKPTRLALRGPHIGGAIFQPDVSRDGKRIAFVWESHMWYYALRDQRDALPPDSNRSIFVAEIGGRKWNDLSAGSADDFQPEWSPDGKLIALSSGSRKVLKPQVHYFDSTVVGHEGHQIFVMNTDGTNRKQITHFPTQCFHPTWSPDGKRIAFTATPPLRIPVWVQANLELTGTERQFLGDLWVINSDGTNPRRLTDIESVLAKMQGWDRTDPWDLPSAWEPRWSPVGNEIVFVYMDQIYLADVDTGVLKQLTDFDPDKVFDHPLDPCWSPGGQHICFAFYRYAGSVPLSHSYHAWCDLYIIRRDGSGLRQLTYSHSARQPSWGGGD